MKKIHLLLIEEHPAVRHALKVRLQSSPLVEIVAAVGNAAEGRALSRRLQPDVVILGLQGSHHEELGVMVKMVDSLAQQKIGVLIVTSYADDVEREMLLQAGADRYLLKDINTPQLIAEIQAVAGQDNHPDGHSERQTAVLPSREDTPPAADALLPAIIPVV
jgi:DNA-binding NarL/FixJ family response regulator